MPDAPASCLTCRAVGASTFFGVSVYLLHVRRAATTVAHGRLLLALSAASGAAAVARMRAD